VTYLYTSKPADAGVLDGMPDPLVLPAWLTDADLDYYARAFERTGFRGALNRYRNLDRDWQELASVANVMIRQPVVYVGGDRDPVVRSGSLEPMKAAPPNLCQIKLSRDAVTGDLAIRTLHISVPFAADSPQYGLRVSEKHLL